MKSKIDCETVKVNIKLFFKLAFREWIGRRLDEITSFFLDQFVAFAGFRFVEFVVEIFLQLRVFDVFLFLGVGVVGSSVTVDVGQLGRFHFGDGWQSWGLLRRHLQFQISLLFIVDFKCIYFDQFLCVDGLGLLINCSPRCCQC